MTRSVGNYLLNTQTTKHLGFKCGSNFHFLIKVDSTFAIGVAKGCGWQHIGVYINLGAFYLVGLPVGAALGFVAHLRGKGLWIGIVAGSVVQSTLLSLATTFTNWKKQVLD